MGASDTASVTFTLFCEPCGKNCTLISDDIELAWYAMQGAISDLRDDVRNGTTEPEFVPEGAICILEALEAARSSEQYAEHATACVEARQRKQDE